MNLQKTIKINLLTVMLVSLTVGAIGFLAPARAFATPKISTVACEGGGGAGVGGVCVGGVHDGRLLSD